MFNDIKYLHPEKVVDFREAMAELSIVVEKGLIPRSVQDAILTEVRERRLQLQKVLSQNIALESIVKTDKLTLIMNRDGLDNAIAKIIAKSKEQLKDGKVVYYLCAAIDLDDFKPVNDHLGHEGGDMVLQLFATILKSVMRDKDIIIGGDSLINDTLTPTEARTGGDEFLSVLPIVFDNYNLEDGNNGETNDDKIKRLLAGAELSIIKKLRLQLSKYKFKKDIETGKVIAVADETELLQGELRVGASIVVKSIRHSDEEDNEVNDAKAKQDIYNKLKEADALLKIDKALKGRR